MVDAVTLAGAPRLGERAPHGDAVVGVDAVRETFPQLARRLPGFEAQNAKHFVRPDEAFRVRFAGWCEPMLPTAEVRHALGAGEPFLTCARSCLRLDARGQVQLHADQVDQRAGVVEHRADGQPVPERRAVFAVVEQSPVKGPLRRQRRADFRDDRPVGVRPLEKAAVAPEDFLARVAGQRAKSRVGEGDREIIRERVAKEHADDRAVDGSRQAAVLAQRAGERGGHFGSVGHR